MNGSAAETIFSESQFFGTLQQQIGSTRLRWRRTELTRNLSLFGVIVLGVGFAMLAIDHWIILPKALRVGCAVFWALTAMGSLFWHVIRPFRSSYSDERVAVHIEKNFPELQNRLVTAIELSRDPNGTSRAFAQEVIRDAAAVCSQVRVEEAVDVRPMQKSLIVFLILLCFTLIYGVFFTKQFFTSARRLMFPEATIAPAYATQVAVQPGSIDVAPGSTLGVKATVSGKPVHDVELDYQFGKGTIQRQKMDSTSANVFDWPVAKVLEDVTYSVKAGDYTSPKYVARVVLRPALNGFNFTLQYPGYTGLKSKAFDAKSGDLTAPIGTKVQLTVDASKDLESAKLALNGNSMPMTLKGKKTATGGFDVQADGTYSVEVTDVNHLSNDPIPSYAVKAVADEPPSVEIVLPGEDLIVAPQDKVSIRVSATDDYGLRQMRLRWFYAGEDQAVKTFETWEIKDNSRKSNPEYELEVPKTNFKPGQSIVYFAEAIDNNPANGGQIGASQRLRIDFVTASQKASKVEEQEFAAKARLAKIIDMQMANREKAKGAQKTLSTASPEMITDLGGRQVDIRKETVGLMDSLDAALMASKPALESLAAREMVDAVKSFQSLEGKSDAAVLDKGLQGGIQVQTAILDKLQALMAKIGEERKAQEMLNLFRSIDEIIEAQKKVRDQTGTSGETPGDGAWKDLGGQENHIYVSTGEYQTSLDQKSQELAQSNAELAKKFAAINQEITGSKVIALMRSVERELAGQAPKGTVPNQEQIIAKLEDINKMLKDSMLGEAKKETDKLKAELAKVSEKLEKLQSVQSAILEKTKEIAKQQDDNAKVLAKQDLGDLAKVQNKEGDVVEAIANDLGLLPDFDASNQLNSKMREIWEDVKAAQEAKNQGASEIAVARDESILQQMKKAGERVKDLEQWLSNSPDSLAWNLENFAKDELPKKIPLTDLPDQLDDIVGDLVDKENELMKQAQDKTSNWAMPDAEMGWDVVDGPMPNFSAKGKTGNQLPNDNEMTGRSGSGRAGKSNGEMVEDFAKALKGRDVEARRTQDPYQKGVVKEENPNEKSGGTGGGKQSGIGNEGLTGSTKTVDMKAWQRMATEQEKMRKSAEELEGALKLLQLPTGEMKASIESMRKVEQHLKDADAQALKAEQVVLMHKLNNTYRALTGSTTMTFDPTLQLPDEMRQQILDARSTRFEPEYQELVEDYFKSLSEAAAK